MSNQRQPPDDLDSILSPTFLSLARNLKDIHVTWRKQVIELGTGMMVIGEPKVAREKLAFTESSLRGNLVFNEESRLAYKEVDSNTSSSYTEHKSVSASVSVGGSLLGASAEGGFNNSFDSNTKGQMTSIHGACCLGVITFKEEPQLRVTARNRVHPRWLRYPDNGDFANTYGEYYVAGLVLGANSSVLAIVDQGEQRSEENWHIKVTVKVLGLKKSGRKDHHEYDYQAYGKMRLKGFDSLTTSIVDLDLDSNRIISSSSRDPLEDFVGLGKTIEARARHELQNLGLRDGMAVDQALCERVCKSGLVVDLLLRPISKVASYVEATYEK